MSQPILPSGVVAFLIHCADLGLSAHIGTTWDTANTIRHDDEPEACRWLVKVNSTKRSQVRGRVAIRAIGDNPWQAAQKAKETLDAIVAKQGVKP
jgi:hypothetical protein